MFILTQNKTGIVNTNECFSIRIVENTTTIRAYGPDSHTWFRLGYYQTTERANLDRMAIIDTASLNVYARQGMGERGIILGSYNSESRCYDVVAHIFDCYRKNEKAYIMPK